MKTSLEELSRLKAGTQDQKREVIDRLAAEGGPAAVQLMVEALADDAWPVRRHAAERLAGLGPPVIEAMGRVLACGSEDQRFWAVKTLVQLGRAALPLLLKALLRGSKPQRIYAAQALGDIGDDSAIPYLVQALGDQVWRVRRNAWQSLVAFGERALPDLKKAMLSENEDVVFWAAKTLGKLGESSREVLLVALRTGSEQLKFIVAAALAETGDTRIVAVLVKNCADRNRVVQKRSAEALGEIGPLAVPGILDALGAADERQAGWLIFALSRMGGPGLEALSEALTTRGDAFRWSVKDPLTQLGDGAVPVLAGLARSEDKNVRFFAVTCLGDVPPTPAVDDLLLCALLDPAWSLRKVAADALAARGLAVLDRLTKALETGDEDLRYWVTYVLRRMGSLGVSSLITALGDSNKNIAYFAASALGDVQDERVVRPLIRALGDEYWPVRRNAADSLKRLARISVSSLVNYINDENEDVQYWVGRILAEVGSEHLDDVVFKLRRGSDEERLFAAKALSILRDKRAVPSLIEALGDRHEWVRLYAAIALGDSGDRRALKHLITLLGEPAFKVTPSIVSVFAGFGEGALPDLLSVVQARESMRVVAAALLILGHLKAPSAFPLIMQGLASADLEERVACVEAIAHYAERPEVLPALTRLLDAGQPARIRQRVLQSLGELGGERVVEPLVAAMGDAPAGRDGRDAILNILAGLGDVALPKLVALLGASRVGLRKAAAEALVHLGPMAQGALEGAAASDDANVRFWSAKVLKGLRDGKLSEGA